MGIFLWILQILLALHTIMGAVWKLSHSEQIIPSLKAIPHRLWLSMSVIELFCSLGLIAPAFHASLQILAPIAAICIAAEMLFFCVVHMYSAKKSYPSVVYWLVVAVLCVLIAYCRVSDY